MSRKRKVIIFVLGVLMASILAIISKSLWPSEIGTEDFDSLAVKIIGFETVATLYFILIYSYNAAMLLHFGKKSTLSNMQTGLRFGVCYGLIYLLGMQEVMVEASPCSQWGVEYVTYQLIMGGGEAVAALLLCLIFGIFLIEKKSSICFVKFGIKRQSITVLLITCVFTLERAIAYETGFIASDVVNYPIPTYTWTVLFGVTLGVCCIILAPVFYNKKSGTRQCFKLTVMTVGFSWMIFNSFIGFIYKGELFNLLIRSGLDVVSVFFAAWLCMKNFHLTFLH